MEMTTAAASTRPLVIATLTWARRRGVMFAFEIVNRLYLYTYSYRRRRSRTSAGMPAKKSS